MITAGIPFGHFRLQYRLGSGGMGEVWRGVHRAQEVPVAVKVLPAQSTTRRTLVTAFHNECRQAARFDHPGIVMVLDYGQVPEEAEEHSGGALVAGSPYLAMEYASGGSLDHVETPVPWTDACEVLLQVLGALAHAHAKGVLHRDIKPGNILFAGEEDLRPGVKLSDLGLAHALRDLDQPSAPLAAGTPQYMAPEQLSGQWREQGPWTDLFAVGCLAHELVCGEPPFSGAEWIALMDARLPTPELRLAPQTLVPEGLEDWLGLLLAKRPGERFQRASDAARALRSLRAPPSPTPLPDRLARRTTLPPSAQTWILDDESTAEVECSPAPTDEAPDVHPWRDWRRPEPAPPPPRLVGAGLGLYELREVPMVGREAERDDAWSALTEVVDTGEPRAVVIRGSSGIGKTRLAWFVADRAHELGASSTLWAVQSPMPTPTHGLVGMLARHLGCVGLSPLELRAHIERLSDHPWASDPEDRAALVRLLLFSSGTHLPGQGADSPFARTAERHAVVARYLERLGRERPVVLVLEDVQWGGDTLAFVEHLLHRVGPEPLPVLALLTARDEDLAMRPAEGAALAELERHDAVRTIHLRALDEQEQAEQVQRLLALDEALSHRVCRRAGGNPLFAARLVGDWVHRGLLEVTDDGFALRAGVAPTLPDDLYATWRGWVDQVLLGEPDGARVALWVASALGQEVDADEWRQAVEQHGAEIPPGLVRTFLAARLFEPVDQGLAFAHAMVRESLQRDAVEAGAWAPVNRACAKVLRGGPQTRGTAARIGRHLVEGGELEAALEVLAVAVQEALTHGDFDGALDLVTLRGTVADRIGLPRGDVRRGEDQVARIQVHLERGEFETADRMAVRCAGQARSHRWAVIEVKCLRARGMAAEKHGDLILAEALFSRAEQLARRADLPDELAPCLEHRGTVLRMQGDRERSLSFLEQARALYQEQGLAVRTADCLREMGGTLVTLGDVDRAAELLAEANRLYERAGHLTGQAGCLNNLGEVLRRRGDLEGAERAYRRSQQLLERLGTRTSVVPRTNLGLVCIARERYGAASDALVGALELAGSGGRRWLEGLIAAALLPCVAHAGDWGAFVDHAERALSLLSETGYVDPDIRWVAGLGESLAREAGQEQPASLAAELRAVQEAVLERPGPTE